MFDMKNAISLFNNLAQDDVVRGMILQAARDIFVVKTDREKGYTEVKYANEGDDLQVLCPDTDNPEGGYRVVNRDNFDQIETIQFKDMEDTFNDYA